MIYTMFIGDNCHECQDVQKELKQLNVELTVFNVDQDAVEPPISIFAYPALFKGEHLIAYGSDIVRYLKKKG